MARLVEVAAGYKNVALPNGRVLDAGETATLTDEQWEALAEDGVPASIIDRGRVEQALAVVEMPRAASASAPASIVVGVTAVQILAPRTNRLSLMVQNVHSTNDLFLGFGADPSVANGIRLQPGDVLGDDKYTGSVRAISSAVSADVRVVEFF